jgi:hypothetical protein
MTEISEFMLPSIGVKIVLITRIVVGVINILKLA